MKIHFTKDFKKAYQKRIQSNDNLAKRFDSLIDSIRETSDPNNPIIHAHHVSGTKASEQLTRELLHEDPSHQENDGTFATFYLGLSDFAELLAPKLRAVRESLRNDESKED